MKEHYDYNIVAQIGEGAALEQLAEEATALAQAALKLARIVRHENPAPVDYETAFYSFLEELGDVRLCAKVLEEKYGKLSTIKGEREKLKRWHDRINEFITGVADGDEKLHRPAQEQTL